MTTDGAIRRAALPAQKVDQDILVVDPKTREVHLLNSTAARVWELLETPQTSVDLLASLAREFDATEDVLRADLRALLDYFEAKALIDVSDW